jgi:hypothetical protein
MLIISLHYVFESIVADFVAWPAVPTVVMYWLSIGSDIG